MSMEKKFEHRYEIRDEAGRLWETTFTLGRARKDAVKLAQLKALKMHIEVRSCGK